ncbi:MAG: ArsR/SmtB family transcription factor [Actinomycetota bacterium]
MAKRVMDLTGRPGATSVQIEAGLCHEFLVSLSAFGQPHEYGTLEVGLEWVENIRRRASADLLQGIERIGARAGKAWVNFLGLATRPPAVREVGDLLGRIEGLAPLDLRLYLLGYHVPAYQGSISREVLRRAAEGDEDAKEVLVGDGAYFGGEAGSMLAPLLSLSPQETRDTAMEVLNRWHREVFREQEREVEPILVRDAEAKKAMLETMSSERLIEVASGIQFIPRPEILQVFLIPQVAMRPWVLLCEHDDTRLFCYPVADESLGGDVGAPPGRLVRLHRALGDEKRLRMLRAIASSTPTLQELVDRFEIPKSTLHHHLAILRAAGLVRVTSDLERRYSVRHDMIPEASALLDVYLGPRL